MAMMVYVHLCLLFLALSPLKEMNNGKNVIRMYTITCLEIVDVFYVGVYFILRMTTLLLSV